MNINHHRLDQFLQRTGYAIVQKNGQRIYFNPNCTERSPPKGCEIFVGKLPRDVFEDEIVPIFDNLGSIYQVRLMMDFNGRNRGFCFVTYHKKEVANMAVVLLNGYEIRRGCKIGIFKSLDNTRLFFGGIPLDKTKEEIRNALSQYIEGIQKVIMYTSIENPKQNRGYVFVEFGEHRMAAIARRRLQPGTLTLWGNSIIVDWADPLPDTDPILMSKVTKLYVRNIDTNLSNIDFKNALCNIVDVSTIIRIHKINDFAFVHFRDRECADYAMRILKGKLPKHPNLINFVLDGRELEVDWARPEIYSNSCAKNKEPNHFCLSLPSRIRRLVKIKRNKSQMQSFKVFDPNPCRQPGTYPAPTIRPFQHPQFQTNLMIPTINKNIFMF